MAKKFCEYCKSYSDSVNVKCPNCSAPLNAEIIADQDNLKEVLTSAVSSGIRSASDAIGKATGTSSQSSSSYSKEVSDGPRMCNKWITMIFIVLTGLMGGHKFYEGKIGLGIFYFFTFGGFFICTIVDFFATLGKKETYPARR